MMHLLKFWPLLAVTVISSATVIPTSDVVIANNSPALPEVYTGPKSIQVRRPSDAAFFFGNAQQALVPLTGGACALAALSVGGALPACVIAVAFSAVFFGVNLLFGIVSAIFGRDGGRDMHGRPWLEAYDHYAFGQFHPHNESYGRLVSNEYDAQQRDTPMFLAHALCGEGNTKYACQAIWYSHTHGAGLNNNTVRRIHITPPDHTWTASPHSTVKPTKTIEKRQTTVTTDNVQVTATDNGQVYYGGYVWSDGADAAVQSFTQDENGNATQITSDIVNHMGDQYGQEDDKYSQGGVYCQSWIDYQSDNSFATEGYLWYYDSPNDYKSDDESQYLQTCQQDAIQSNPNTKA